jgi:hypothetical protein
MKAVVYSQAGGPDVLRLPTPCAGAGRNQFVPHTPRSRAAPVAECS